MQINLDNLPRDPARLHSLVHDMAALLEHRDGKIRQLQRMQLGRRSERLDPGQLALGLEDLGADIAAVEESHQTRHKPTSHSRPHRKPLPEYLALIAVGQTALASSDAYGTGRFKALLVFINPAVDPARGSVEIKLSVPEPPAYTKGH